MEKRQPKSANYLMVLLKPIITNIGEKDPRVKSKNCRPLTFLLIIYNQ
jgi:hypothetical protein